MFRLQKIRGSSNSRIVFQQFRRFESGYDHNKCSDYELSYRHTHLDYNRMSIARLNIILNVCPNGKKMIIERFGKLHKIAEPGLFLAIPFIDKIKYIVDMRELILNVKTVTGITKDNVKVSVGGTLFLRVINAEKACYAVSVPFFSLLELTKSTNSTAISTYDLDTLLHDRSIVNTKICNDISNKTKNWGIHIPRYELQEVIIDYKAEDKVQETIYDNPLLKISLENKS